MLISKLPWTLEYDPESGPNYHLKEPGESFAALRRDGKEQEARELVRRHAEYIRKCTWLYDSLIAAVRHALLALQGNYNHEAQAISDCKNVLSCVDGDGTGRDCPMCGFVVQEVYCEFGGRQFHPECYVEFERQQADWLAELAERDALEAREQAAAAEQEAREMGLIPTPSWRF